MSDSEILYSSIMENEKDKIKSLYEADVDFNVLFGRNMNLLHLSGYYSKSRLDLQRNMLEHILNDYVIGKMDHLIHQEDNCGETPLFYCCNRREVELLVDCGADVNHTSKTGQISLFYADIDMSRVLLENGADVNKIDENGRSALFTAGVEKCNLLISYGCNIHHLDKEGRNALFSNDIIVPFSTVNEYGMYEKMGVTTKRLRAKLLISKGVNPKLMFKNRSAGSLIEDAIYTNRIINFFRYIVAFNKMNILRYEPDNLFSEEFKEFRMEKIKVRKTYDIMGN